MIINRCVYAICRDADYDDCMSLTAQADDDVLCCCRFCVIKIRLIVLVLGISSRAAHKLKVMLEKLFSFDN